MSDHARIAKHLFANLNLAILIVKNCVNLVFF